MKDAQSKAPVNILISEQDSASGNKKFLAHELWQKGRAMIIFWIFCLSHQTHQVQGFLLTVLDGALDLVHALYSGSLLLVEGTYWLRLVQTIER